MGRVIIDTAAWSLAIRRRTARMLSPSETEVRVEVERLAANAEAVLLGAVRQELLSGMREIDRFLRIRTALRAFPEEPVRSTDHERAAEMANVCRAMGIQGSPTDFLLCSVSERLGASILTGDADFNRFRIPLSISLHSVD